MCCVTSLVPFLFAAGLLARGLCGQEAADSATDSSAKSIGAHKFQRRTLANGLRAVAVRDDAEGLSVFMVVGAGKRHETPATSGLAHLTEHAMYAGTEKLGLGGHDRRIRAIGGESNAFTREDYTMFYDHNFPAEHLAAVLSMEADRLRGLTFNAKSVLFERERLRIEEEHTWSWSDTRSEQVDAAVYQTQGYRAGVPDAAHHTMAPKLSVAVVKDFYDRFYHPDHCSVVVVGDIDAKVALDAVEKAFGTLPRGPKRAPLPTEAPIEKTKTVTHATDLARERREFVWLVPGLGHPDRPALQILARLLSRRTAKDGSPIAAIMANRVDQEVFRLAATGPAADRELAALVGGLHMDLLKEEEVAMVVKLLGDDFTSMPMRARPYFSLAATFGIHEVYGQVDHLVNYADEIKAVTPERLQEVARTYLRSEAQVTVVFEASKTPAKPLPNGVRNLQLAAEEAQGAGDLDRAIAAYTKLLQLKTSKMYKVIFLAERGQIRVNQKDYKGAIHDYESALAVINYPAVRDLLVEAKLLQAGKASQRGGDAPKEEKKN